MIADFFDTRLLVLRGMVNERNAYVPGGSPTVNGVWYHDSQYCVRLARL